MLHGGTIYRAGAPETVLTADAIEHVYGVTVDIHRNGGCPTIIPRNPVPVEHF